MAAEHALAWIAGLKLTIFILNCLPLSESGGWILFVLQELSRTSIIILSSGRNIRITFFWKHHPVLYKLVFSDTVVYRMFIVHHSGGEDCPWQNWREWHGRRRRLEPAVASVVAQLASNPQQTTSKGSWALAPRLPLGLGLHAKPAASQICPFQHYKPMPLMLLL